MPQLRLLRLNYKGRPIDDTVIDFFRISCQQLTTLQFFDVKEITLEDLRTTVGQCPQLEVLVFQDCSVVPDWRSQQSHIKVISRSVDHLQVISNLIKVNSRYLIHVPRPLLACFEKTCWDSMFCKNELAYFMLATL